MKRGLVVVLSVILLIAVTGASLAGYQVGKEAGFYTGLAVGQRAGYVNGHIDGSNSGYLEGRKSVECPAPARATIPGSTWRLQ